MGQGKSSAEQNIIPVTRSEIYDAYTTKNLDYIANSGLLCKVMRNATSSYSSWQNLSKINFVSSFSKSQSSNRKSHHPALKVPPAFRMGNANMNNVFGATATTLLPPSVGFSLITQLEICVRFQPRDYETTGISTFLPVSNSKRSDLVKWTLSMRSNHSTIFSQIIIYY